MGSARSRAWSHSRQRLYDSCPRAYFFQYFPWGEPEQDQIWFLRRVKTPAMLAGTIVHDAITMALRGIKESGHVVTDLHVPAVARYDLIVRESERIADIVCRGKRPPDNGDVLLHHLRQGPSECMESAIRGGIEDALRAFEASHAWAVLRASNPKGWLNILTDTDERPHFLASRELGFESAHGLRVYAVYDLALRHDGVFTLVDWKTGKRTPEAVAAARKQCAAYALWALGHPKLKRAHLRVHPYFLTANQPWQPEPIDDDEIEAARQTIEKHDALESSIVEHRKGPDGKFAFFALREDFPARPRPRLCDGCKFKELCPDAKAMEIRELDA